jgi:hypothetical protein
MNLTLKIWRQKNANEKGKIVEYKATDISPDMSFLEMMDVVNTDIIVQCISTEKLMGPAGRLRLANYTCVNSKTEKQSTLNHGEPKHFLLLKI